MAAITSSRHLSTLGINVSFTPGSFGSVAGGGVGEGSGGEGTEGAGEGSGGEGTEGVGEGSGGEGTEGAEGAGSKIT